MYRKGIWEKERAEEVSEKFMNIIEQKEEQ
jgi:hypothetical protein